MIFRLLKSRRITASNGATGNSLRRTPFKSAVATLALCGVAGSVFAGDPGATLKWKARGTAASAHDVAVEPSRPEPRKLEATSPRDIRLVAHDVVPTQAASQLDDPLKNPFGDKSPPSKLPSAPNILPPTPTQPTPSPSLPDFGDTSLPGIVPGTQSAQGTGNYANEPCPKPGDLKSISQLTNVIAASAGDLPQECTINDRVEPSTNRPYECVTFTWKASGLCHKPLYFEEQNLERYGHSTGPISQPVVSAAHFFLTVPVLPYKMGIRPPWECEYALGYYRPGNCAPYVIPGVPITARAIATQAAATAATIAILP